MRLFRGAGGRGLGSLQPVKDLGGTLLIRPLLCFFRAEIIGYLNDRGIPYRIDATNLETSTDRGRIRNVIIPQLEKMAQESGLGSVRESLARSAELLAEDEVFLQSQVESYMAEVDVDDMGGLHIPVGAIGSLPKPILGRLVLEVVARIDPEIRPEREHVEAIMEMLKGRRSGACVMPGGLKAEPFGDSVVVHFPTMCLSPRPEAVKVSLEELPTRLVFGPYRMEFAAAETPDVSPGVVTISVPEDEKHLTVRTPETGERMAPLGMGGHTRKLSDIFTDRKIPKDERRVEPVVLNESCDEVLALPRLGIISEKARIEKGATGRVIRIEVMPPT
jgi:tRNA(Ile)-lysidine synthase